MWDLTVSDVHTFAVGEGEWVVHNAGPCRPLTPSLGSTGRTTPSNLVEHLAMEEVMADPIGRPVPMVMKDARWPASQGWVKMESTQHGVVIHWVENITTGEVDDFKFK
jgi:hypothetical protein